MSLTRRWIRACGCAAVAAAIAAGPVAAQGRQQPDAEQSQEGRQEAQALLELADAAMKDGQVPADFPLEWRNDFLKAQEGTTFVPFTITMDPGKAPAGQAMLYVRVAPRGATGPAEPPPAPAADTRRRDRREREQEAARAKAAAETYRPYPFDQIYPIEVKGAPGEPFRVSRGFTVPGGEYDVYVVVRERTGETPAASVLEQPLTVPDFWSGELTTSSVIVADGLNTLSAPLSPEQQIERPYVLGQNDIQVAHDLTFRKDEEILVLFLIYNPTVQGRAFDVQVDYHFFQRGGGDGSASAPPDDVTPKEGERYFNRTEPQRFSPEQLGPQFDLDAGHQLMAGQGVPLAGFAPGDYRLEIKVTDLLSRKSLTRDVNFTVVGS